MRVSIVCTGYAWRRSPAVLTGVLLLSVLSSVLPAPGKGVTENAAGPLDVIRPLDGSTVIGDDIHVVVRFGGNISQCSLVLELDETVLPMDGLVSIGHGLFDLKAAACDVLPANTCLCHSTHKLVVRESCGEGPARIQTADFSFIPDMDTHSHADRIYVCNFLLGFSSLTSIHPSVLQLARDQTLEQGDVVVVVDAWDRHWCREANSQMDRISSRLSAFLEAQRKRGILVIHVVYGLSEHSMVHERQSYDGNQWYDSSTYNLGESAIDQWYDSSIYDVADSAMDASAHGPPLDGDAARRTLKDLPTSLLEWEGCLDDTVKTNDLPTAIHSKILVDKRDAVILERNPRAEPGSGEAFGRRIGGDRHGFAERIFYRLLHLQNASRVVYTGLHLDRCLLWSRSISMLASLQRGLKVAVIADLTEPFPTRQWSTADARYLLFRYISRFGDILFLDDDLWSDWQLSSSNPRSLWIPRNHFGVCRFQVPSMPASAVNGGVSLLHPLDGETVKLVVNADLLKVIVFVINVRPLGMTGSAEFSSTGNLMAVLVTINNRCGRIVVDPHYVMGLRHDSNRLFRAVKTITGHDCSGLGMNKIAVDGSDQSTYSTWALFHGPLGKSEICSLLLAFNTSSVVGRQCTVFYSTDFGAIDSLIPVPPAVPKCSEKARAVCLRLFECGLDLPELAMSLAAQISAIKSFCGSDYVSKLEVLLPRGRNCENGAVHKYWDTTSRVNTAFGIFNYRYATSADEATCILVETSASIAVANTFNASHMAHVGILDMHPIDSLAKQGADDFRTSHFLQENIIYVDLALPMKWHDNFLPIHHPNRTTFFSSVKAQLYQEARNASRGEFSVFVGGMSRASDDELRSVVSLCDQLQIKCISSGGMMSEPVNTETFMAEDAFASSVVVAISQPIPDSRVLTSKFTIRFQIGFVGGESGNVCVMLYLGRQHVGQMDALSVNGTAEHTVHVNEQIVLAALSTCTKSPGGGFMCTGRLEVKRNCVDTKVLAFDVIPLLLIPSSISGANTIKYDALEMSIMQGSKLVLTCGSALWFLALQIDAALSRVTKVLGMRPVEDHTSIAPALCRSRILDLHARIESGDKQARASLTLESTPDPWNVEFLEASFMWQNLPAPSCIFLCVEHDVEGVEVPAPSLLEVNRRWTTVKEGSLDFRFHFRNLGWFAKLIPHKARVNLSVIIVEDKVISSDIVAGDVVTARVEGMSGDSGLHADDESSISTDGDDVGKVGSEARELCAIVGPRGPLVTTQPEMAVQTKELTVNVSLQIAYLSITAGGWIPVLSQETMLGAHSKGVIQKELFSQDGQYRVEADCFSEGEFHFASTQFAVDRGKHLILHHPLPSKECAGKKTVDDCGGHGHHEEAIGCVCEGNYFGPSCEVDLSRAPEFLPTMEDRCSLMMAWSRNLPELMTALNFDSVEFEAQKCTEEEGQLHVMTGVRAFGSHVHFICRMFTEALGTGKMLVLATPGVYGLQKSCGPREGLACYFVPLSPCRSSEVPAIVRQKPAWGIADLPVQRIAGDQGDLWWRSVLYDRILKPTHKFQVTVQQWQGVIGLRTPSIGLHIRRGDSCDYAKNTGMRPLCVPISSYIKAAMRLDDRVDLRAAGLFVSTDDSSVVAEVKEAVLAVGWKVEVTSLPHDRASLNAPFQFWGHIEWRMESKLMDVELASDSVALDLMILRSCDALIGSFASSLSRIGYGLMSSRLGRPAPFISIDNSSWNWHVLEETYGELVDRASAVLTSNGEKIRALRLWITACRLVANTASEKKLQDACSTNLLDIGSQLHSDNKSSLNPDANALSRMELSDKWPCRRHTDSCTLESVREWLKDNIPPDLNSFR